jgi:putative membrane protein
MDMMWDMPAMMLIGTLFWIAVILAISASIWWAIRRGWPTRRDPALDVLRERYARGEISREEFEARRRDLDA